VLNTILYNWNEEIKDEVTKRPTKTSAPSTTAATIITSKRPSIRDNVDSVASNNDALFDRKIELITQGIDSFYVSLLKELSQDNALTIVNYVLSMKNEINISDNYRRLNIYTLYRISKFFNNSKSYKELVRDDILQFLDSFRKPEASDPLHKWIGTYNIYRTLFIRFFKWLYYPDIEQKKRPKPEVIENISLLKRKEQSIYKPSDLWTLEDDLFFLKYCPSAREKCYHTISRDLSCRPHEILNLKLKDIIFKNNGDYQYAEVLLNGKTGSRNIPLISSIPYLKDWIDQHPQTGNPNSPLICGLGKTLGRRLTTPAIYRIYRDYREKVFPKILDNPSVSPEDKQKIKELLKKPWNPYIRRHSLTEKSMILNEHVLRQHAGWSGRSQMHLKYLHYFGNESSESLLEAYGIMPKGQQIDQLKPKQCPNCSEPNKPDSKFCANCRMVLTYSVYSETVEEKQQKESEGKELKDKYEQDMKSMREEMNQQFTQIMSMIQQNPQLAHIKPEALTNKKLE
jgi:integrase/recombinase XerD